MTTYETLSLIVSAAAVLSIWFGSGRCAELAINAPPARMPATPKPWKPSREGSGNRPNRSKP